MTLSKGGAAGSRCRHTWKLVSINTKCEKCGSSGVLETDPLPFEFIFYTKATQKALLTFFRCRSCRMYQEVRPRSVAKRL
jgi:hypothetical protein